MSERDRTRADIEQQLDSEAAARLARNLNRTKRGYSLDIRTPFFKKAEREEVIALFEETLGSTQYEELTAIDEHEKSKCGPISIMLPWEKRRDSLEEYRHQEFHGDDSSLGRAMDDVVQILPSSALRPMDIHTAVEAMPKGTLLGLPTMSSDESLIPQYEQRAKQAKTRNDIEPAVVGWRGQSAGLHVPPKQRIVWMQDHAVIILDLSLMYPVLNALRVKRGFAAWSNSDVVDAACTDLIQKAEQRGDTIISMDFSHFDASIHYTLLNLAFECLLDWFTDNARDRLTLLLDVISSIEMITPDGVFGGRKGGMPSGSGLTNLVDTLVNLIAGHYVARRLGVRLMDFLVLGDDSVYVYHPTPPIKEVTEAMAELGLECNPDKQFLSTHSVHFLQCWHSSMYSIDGIFRGVRSPYRALPGFLGLERWVGTAWTKYMATARLIMQAENTRWDPRFKDVVRLLKRGDDVLASGVLPPEVFKRAGGADVIRSSLSIASFPYNSRDPDDVKEFAVTRVLRELNGQ